MFKRQTYRKTSDALKLKLLTSNFWTLGSLREIHNLGSGTLERKSRKLASAGQGTVPLGRRKLEILNFSRN